MLLLATERDAAGKSGCQELAVVCAGSVTHPDAPGEAARHDASVRIGVVIVVVLGIVFALGPRADAALRNGPIVFWVQTDCGIDGCEDILSDGIFAADPRTGATHELVAGGYHFAFSSDGRRLAYLDSEALWIARTDGTHATRVVRQGGALFDVHDLVWRGDGKQLAFPLSYASVIHGHGTVGAGLYVLSPDGRDLRRIYQNAHITQVSWPTSGPLGFAITDDCPAFSCPGDLYRLSGESLVHVRVSTGLRPAITSWSPDGQRLLMAQAYRHSPRGLFVAAADGHAPKRILSAAISDAAWSPDSRRIVAVIDNHQIWTVDADGRGPHRVRVNPQGGSDLYQDVAWQPVATR